jgi:hypothetical protein
LTEHEIEAEARLEAIEFLLANLYAKILLEQSDPNATIDTGVRSLLGGLRDFAITGIDPDRLAAEAQDAIERLLHPIQQMVKTELRR